MPYSPPIHFLDSRWQLAKQIKGVPQWTGHVEVASLEFDEHTGEGVIHLVAQPGDVWRVKLSLASFQRMVDVEALVPLM